MICKAFFESFEPVQITIQCNCKGNSHVGELSVGIRSVKINLLDLSMGGVVPGNPVLSSETDMQIAIMDFSESTEIGKIKEALEGTSEQFKEISKIVREKLIKKSLLE